MKWNKIKFVDFVAMVEYLKINEFLKTSISDKYYSPVTFHFN